jgi:hypothetical protein
VRELTNNRMFKCPSCNGTQLECCQTDAILTTDVHVEDGEVIYGEPEISDATTDRFQCKNCVTDDDELVEWLTENNSDKP